MTREEIERRLDELCFMDDVFAMYAFKDDKESVQLILRVIMDKPDLVVQEVRVKDSYVNLLDRGVELDVSAVDSEGKMYDIELQKRSDGASPKRARYNSSIMDTRLLHKNDDFTALPETYVIFITETDVLGGGLPLYTIKRRIEQLDNKYFGDGSNIIYVNGRLSDPDTALGRLMHDMKCPKADEMYNERLAERMRHFKETKEGREYMSDFVEDLRRETEYNRCVKDIINMVKFASLPFDMIAKVVELPENEVRTIARNQGLVF